MPSLEEFLNKPENKKPYELEQLNGIRGCSKCDEDVAGAIWDPVELIMRWECSSGHITEFQVG